MSKIWYLALEPLESRYTGDWMKQFPEVWEVTGRNYEVILGEPQAKQIDRKFFLDPLGTNKWKLTQLGKLLDRISEVNDEDTIFIPDGWYPGIEILGYIRNMMDRKFKLAAYWHAGTYDPWDLTAQSGMDKWAGGLEHSWFILYDINFVATEFHKDLIQARYDVPDEKFRIVGFPLDLEGIKKKYRTNERTKDIMFTGRLSSEKGMEVIEELKKEYNITILSELGLRREDYFKELAKGKVVIAPSKQETFGIGVLEGATLGLLPVVPDKLSFKETLSDVFRYNSMEEMKAMIERGLDKVCNEPDLRRYQYQEVIKKMSEEM